MKKILTHGVIKHPPYAYIMQKTPQKPPPTLTDKEYNKAIDLWADAAYRFARRCCNDDERCRDAVQDAFASMWEHRDEVRNDTGKSYLLTMVHNRLMSVLRHERVLNTAPPPIEETTPPDEGFDVRDAIELALRTLPPLQQQCLQLRDVEGYSYKEISNILNISDQQVQVYIYRARVALQKKLKEFRS